MRVVICISPYPCHSCNYGGQHTYVSYPGSPATQRLSFVYAALKVVGAWATKLKQRQSELGRRSKKSLTSYVYYLRFFFCCALTYQEMLFEKYTTNRWEDNSNSWSPRHVRLGMKSTINQTVQRIEGLRFNSHDVCLCI